MNCMEKTINNKSIIDFLDWLSDPRLFKTSISWKFESEVVEYSNVLDKIKKLDSETKDILYKNISSYKSSEEVIDIKIKKLVDYVLMEIQRSIDQDNIKNQVQTMKNIIAEFKTAERQNRQKMDTHETKMEKMQGEFITILSIFSAVIIAFFGGISILGSVFSNVHNISRYKLIFTILALGFIMFNLIYMLLYTISKIIGKSINININSELCLSCTDDSFIKCLRRKYPIVFFYNITTLFLCITIFISYLFDKYNFISYIISKVPILPDNINMIPIVGIFSGIVFILILKMIFKYFLFPKKCTCSNLNND